MKVFAKAALAITTGLITLNAHAFGPVTPGILSCTLDGKTLPITSQAAINYQAIRISDRVTAQYSYGFDYGHNGAAHTLSIIIDQPTPQHPDRTAITASSETRYTKADDLIDLKTNRPLHLEMRGQDFTLKPNQKGIYSCTVQP